MPVLAQAQRKDYLLKGIRIIQKVVYYYGLFTHTEYQPCWPNTALLPTRQYIPLTKLLYLTPMYILVLNDLCSSYKSVFTDLVIQQTVHESVNIISELLLGKKGRKTPLLPHTNIYSIELSRAAGLPQDTLSRYLFQCFCKLFIWEITYTWNFHMDFCLGHQFVVNLLCIQSHVSWRPLVWPEGNSVLFHCALRRNHAMKNHKGFGAKTDSFENSSCVSNKKENPECHKNS